MENKQNFAIPKIITFSEEATAPDLKWHKSKGYLRWGKNNDYPEMLLDYYNVNGSSVHKAIINKKIKLIAGNGFKTNTLDNPEAFNIKYFIKRNQIKKLINKLATDYELFNGFAYEVVWSKDGTSITSIQHIPFHKLRIGFNEEKPNMPLSVWFSNNWQAVHREENLAEEIPLLDFDNRIGKQVYYHVEYNPASEFYPTSGYFTGINYIDLGWRISNFHLNQVRNGYAPSYILNFSGSIPTDEEQELFQVEFNKKYKSDHNAGKIILAWSDLGENAPELIPINGNDSDTRFNMLNEQIRQEIAVAHEIPIPLIASIPGSLGSASERDELMTEFQFTYIDQRQEVIEDALNEVFMYAPATFEIVLNKYEIKKPEGETVTFAEIIHSPNSSNVNRVKWDSVTLKCIVEFIGGGTYTYSGVRANDVFRFLGKEAQCITDDTTEGRWWVGKPSVGAGVKQILENYPYEEGGTI